MTERSLTLVEIHLDEASVQLGSRTFGTASGDREDVISESDVEEDRSDIEGDRSDVSRCTARALSGALLLGVLVLALAAAAWKAFGGSDLDTVEELDALDD